MKEKGLLFQAVLGGVGRARTYDLHDVKASKSIVKYGLIHIFDSLAVQEVTLSPEIILPKNSLRRVRCVKKVGDTIAAMAVMSPYFFALKRMPVTF